MESTAQQTRVGQAVEPAAAPGTSAAQATIVDTVGMWYVARARHGVGDNNWFGFATRGNDGRGNETEILKWQNLPHREADGIGAMTRLLGARGFTGGRTPTGKDNTPPALRDVLAGWRRWRKQTRHPERTVIRWRFLDPQRAQLPHDGEPVCVFLGNDDYTHLRQAARAAGVSTTLWLQWTLDRATRQTLAEPDAVLPWVFPVNLRGAVPAASDYANLCSGLGVVLTRETTPAELATQIRDRFAALEHWRQWWLLSLGRWLGQRGVNLVYRLARDKPGSWAGSYSNLGAWPLPGMAQQTVDDDAITGAICASPGSPGYPISTGIVEWRGRLALACRVHPVADADGRSASRLLDTWRALACGNPPGT